MNDASPIPVGRPRLLTAPCDAAAGTVLGIPLEDALLSHAGTKAVLPPGGICAKYPEIKISAELGDLRK